MKKLRALHDALGIAPDYGELTHLPLCHEPQQLEATGPDMFDRPQQLAPAALAAWRRMQAAAAEQGVRLLMVSAFRSWQYQHDLIARKLDRGQLLADILKVNAAPGYSEHHSGCAVDVATDGCEPLSEDFEKTTAFQWLEQNAADHGFRLSYPRDNELGIAYEPWHWCFHGLEARQNKA
ncbi:MAG: M15 family metallopeptidase [Gammaproteobacteria bacterium]